MVDGIGYSHRVASMAEPLATVMARVAARRGGLAGLLTGTEPVADKGAGDEPEPDDVAVVATVTATASCSTSASAEEGRIRLAWVGDCRAYALEGVRLRPLTADHNLAETWPWPGTPARSRAGPPHGSARPCGVPPSPLCRRPGPGPRWRS